MGDYTRKQEFSKNINSGEKMKYFIISLLLTGLLNVMGFTAPSVGTDFPGGPGGWPARIQRVTDHGLVDESAVSSAFVTGAGRYRVRLLVPFATLGQPTDATTFAFDLSVITAPASEAGYVRAYLAKRINQYTDGYARVMIVVVGSPNQMETL